VGDVLAALAEVCERYGLSLHHCANAVVEKLRRKAPQWRAEMGDRMQKLRARMDG
jgi:hypothetical protein